MDPDATYEGLQASLRRYLAQDSSLTQVQVDALVEHVMALDDWLKKGGFLPQAWRAAKTERSEAPLDPRTVIERGLAEFNAEKPKLPDARSIERFWEAVRTLHREGRIR